jgi:4'-phosphopantetheinyl transferase
MRTMQTRRTVESGPRLFTVWLRETTMPLEKAWASLSPTEQERAERFRFPDDHRRYVIGRSVLRHLLAAELDVEPASVSIASGPDGKPRLAATSGQPELHFNVSHSRDLAVIGLWSRELGVDVEAISPLTDIDDLAHQYFSEGEYAEFSRLSPDAKTIGFFNCWTRKEAILKALGSGLSFPLDRFDVSLAPGVEARVNRFEERLGADCGWALHSFTPAPGFVAACAARVEHELNPSHEVLDLSLSMNR